VQVDTSPGVEVQANGGDGALARAGSEHLGRRGSAQRLGSYGGDDAANDGAVPLVRLRIKVKTRSRAPFSGGVQACIDERTFCLCSMTATAVHGKMTA